MKVLFIRDIDRRLPNTRLPKSIENIIGIYPPLGLLYLAAVLEKEGHKTNILDAQLNDLSDNEIRKKIENFKPDFVGITCMTPNIQRVYEIAKIVKEISKNIMVVVGGPHLSVYPTETLTNQFIDYGIIGEGEYTFLDLLNNIEKSKKIEKIPGIIFKKNGKIINNGPRIVEDLNKLPFPARHLIENEKYHCLIAEKPFTILITARGCPWRCGFCFKTPSDFKVRFRSPDNVVDEMIECKRKYKMKEIMIYDDTFTTSKNHIEALCKKIIERKLDIIWEAQTRVDSNLTKSLLELMKKAGCIRLRIGVENGNQNILNIMNKKIKINQVKKLFRSVRLSGIETFANFIIGYAYENVRTINKTINFAKELNPDWAMFYAAVPYPNTDLYRKAFETGIIENDYWLDFVKNKKVGEIPYFIENANKWVKKAYMNFYFRPSFTLNNIRKINSISKIKLYSKGFISLLFFSMRDS